MVIAFAFASAALVPACGPPRGGHGRTSSRDDLVCIQDPQTGSHIVETRCYRRDVLDERREADRAILERAQMNANRPRASKRGEQ